MPRPQREASPPTVPMHRLWVAPLMGGGLLPSLGLFAALGPVIAA